MTTLTPHRYIALNGFGYSIAKWLPTCVNEVFRINWNTYFALLLARQLDASPLPTTLIGFSDGATASLQVAEHAKCVQRVYCHSCMRPRAHTRNRKIDLVFFRTLGDRTPTFTATADEHAAYLRDGHAATLVDIDFVPFDRPTLLERRTLTRLRHQFHNCLPWLLF